MLAEIVNAFIEMGKHTPVVAAHTCKYCNKSFVRESTLSTHMCERKRRFSQEKEQGVQLGYNAYLKFFESTQSSSKTKSYEDFVNSDFYIAFVKYGRYQVAIRSVNFISFTGWLIKQNKKLDDWTKDVYYITWLQEYIRREAAVDALERSLKEMQEYADSEPTLGDDFSAYFKSGNSNRIVHHIVNGRLSPWVIYNCDSGIDWLSELGQEHLSLVMPWIDPDFWQKKFRENREEVAWIKSVLGGAGL